MPILYIKKSDRGSLPIPSLAGPEKCSWHWNTVIPRLPHPCLCSFLSLLLYVVCRPLLTLHAPYTSSVPADHQQFGMLLLQLPFSRLGLCVTVKAFSSSSLWCRFFIRFTPRSATDEGLHHSQGVENQPRWVLLYGPPHLFRWSINYPEVGVAYCVDHRAEYDDSPSPACSACAD